MPGERIMIVEDNERNITLLRDLLSAHGYRTIEARSAEDAIALVPDLLAYWLCGELANEATNASTTGLLDARSGQWAGELIERHAGDLFEEQPHQQGVEVGGADSGGGLGEAEGGVRQRDRVRAEPVAAPVLLA